MYVKRLLFWLLGFVWTMLLALNHLYSRTLGFYIYRAIEKIKKRLQRFSLTKQQSVLDVFGRRGMLQALLFAIALLIMFPHSRLYTRAYDEIAGRKTLLYSLAGPGDQAYDLDEIVGSIDTIPISNNGTWKQVAVYSGDSVAGFTRNQIDFTSVVEGGSVLTKPIIMPGVDYGLSDPGQLGNQIGIRNEVITYEVQPGDVLGTIATKFGLRIETILSANNLTPRSYIRPGQKLTILPVDGVVYTIVKGDTVSKIARVYGGNSESIIAFNALDEDGTSLSVGDQIIIPNGKKPVVKPIVTAQPIVTKPDAIGKVTAPPPSVDAPAGVGYIWPTGATIITQYFGLRHTGVDIAGKIGTPIYATKSGTVITSQCGWNGGYGCYIKIDHGGGIVSWYGHASQMFVEVGDMVEQGQTIALIGSTGRSTGPHLHFEIRVNNKYQNPLSYVRK